MTMFVHHAIVHCGEDRCWHGKGHCQYIRFTGEEGKAIICSIFGVELVPVLGTGAPGRCDECLTAETGRLVPAAFAKQPEEPEEPAGPCNWCRWWGTSECSGEPLKHVCWRFVPKQPGECEELPRACCYDVDRERRCTLWNTPECTGSTHTNICHNFAPKP
jgi:hypothetical protein